MENTNTDNTIIKKGTACQYFIGGLHCPSCELIIEKKLSGNASMKNVDVVLASRKIYFELQSDMPESKLLENINEIIQKDGYRISKNAPAHKVKWLDLLKGFLAAGLILSVFILLQKFGIAGLLKVSSLTLPVSFLIGVIASLSSCMAVVGGLVLSISSGYARTNEKVWPLFLFHSARIAGFFIFGGVLGIAGSYFTINQTANFVISIVLFVLMIVIGLNLLDVSPFLSKFQLRVPKSFSRKIMFKNGLQSRFIPVILGILTFFLPCGFTQSMQLSSMTAGSFVGGGLLMLVFSLGTLPVLGIISFSSIRFSRSSFSGVFFKAAGFMLIFFALFNFVNALVSSGVIVPFF